ncbi:MAG: PEP-CTERM sorting domain-containing protein, partial [Dehalococcoidia bacterium]
FSTSVVSDAAAYAGTQSYASNFQFVDADPSRWLRLSSFDALNLPNPAILLRSAAGGQDPSISFWAAGRVVPEPSSLAAVVVLASFGLCGRRRSPRVMV